MIVKALLIVFLPGRRADTCRHQEIRSADRPIYSIFQLDCLAEVIPCVAEPYDPVELNHMSQQMATETRVYSQQLPVTSPRRLHSLLLPISKKDLVAGYEDAPCIVANQMSEAVDYITVATNILGPNQATLNALVAAPR